MNSNEIKNVDDYIAGYSEEIKEILDRIRSIIREASPDAVESIAYGIPAYKLNKKPLVYFAAFKNHIGFYATPTGHIAFAKELSAYKQGKGSVQFPLNSPIPYDIISQIVAFRVYENSQIGSIK